MTTSDTDTETTMTDEDADRLNRLALLVASALIDRNEQLEGGVKVLRLGDTLLVSHLDGREIATIDLADVVAPVQWLGLES